MKQLHLYNIYYTHTYVCTSLTCTLYYRIYTFMIGLGYFAIQGGAISEEFTFVISIAISLKQKAEYI